MKNRLAQFLVIAIFVVSQSVMTHGLSAFAQNGLSVNTDLSAYTLPDGTVPTLCLTVDEDGTDSQHLCDGCLCCAVDLGSSNGSSYTMDRAIDLVELLHARKVTAKRIALKRTRAPPLAT